MKNHFFYSSLFSNKLLGLGSRYRDWRRVSLTYIFIAVFVSYKGKIQMLDFHGTAEMWLLYRGFWEINGIEPLNTRTTEVFMNVDIYDTNKAPINMALIYSIQVYLGYLLLNFRS